MGAPRPSRVRLYAAVFVVDLLYMSTGCVLTWPSPVLPHLAQSGLIDPDQGSWIGSLMAVGAFFGPLLNSVCIHRLGRKPLLLLNAAFFLVAWIILAASTRVSCIYLARFLSGVAVGLSFNSIPVYLTEIADDQVRQAVTSLAEFFIGVGYMIEYGLGPFLDYTYIQVVSAVAVVFFILPFCCIPETPYYLCSKGKTKEAAASLAWFRGLDHTDSRVLSELATIETIMQQDNNEKPKLTEQLSKRGHRRALLMSLLCLFIQQLSGVNVIVSFAEPILASTSLAVSPAVGAMVVGLFNLFSSSFAPPLVRRFGTKKVLIFCSLIMGFALIAFSAYTCLESYNYDVSTVNLLPIITLVIFNIFFCIGVGPLPWSIVAELSPADFRGFTTATVSSFSWLVSFALMRSYAPVSALVGSWPVFASFGASLLVGALAIGLLLPDTKGLSLLQIQELLQGQPLASSQPSLYTQSVYL